MEQRYIAALEIGSSKVSCAVGILDNNDTLSVIAIEEENFIDSVRYGCIKNLDDVYNHVKSVISKIENRSGIAPRQLKGVYVGIGGRSVSLKAKEISENFNEDIEITEQIITRLKNSVDCSQLPDKYELISLEPREFIVDNAISQKPVGTVGNHLKIIFNEISGKALIKNNLNRVFSERLQLPVYNYILRPTAQANMVLTTDEKHLGCMLVDFGAETTTVAIYKADALQYLATIPLGSRNITRDLTSLNITETRAEELKIKEGTVAQQDKSQYQDPIDGFDSNEMSDYINARASEIIANIHEQINFANLKTADLPGGIIIIGNGAKLRGFNAMLESQSGMQVRMGAPLPHIRIADASIRPFDAIDVISILAAASQLPERDSCFMLPIEPEQVELFNDENYIEEDDDNEEDENIYNEEDEYLEDEEEEIFIVQKPQKEEKKEKKREPKPEVPKKPGFFTRKATILKDKIANLLSENEEEDDEEESK